MGEPVSYRWLKTWNSKSAPILSIPTYIDSKHAIAHNKIMVIDGYEILTGSFNFTKAAEEKNAENLLVIQDAPLAAKYAENWRNHLMHSEAYAGR